MTSEDSGSFYLSQQPWVSDRTRAEVIAELRPARANGQLAELGSESSHYPVMPRHAAAQPALRYVGTDTQGEARPSHRMALTSDKR